MSWPYHYPHQTWPTTMDQLRWTLKPDHTSHQRLMNWINHTSSSHPHGDIWEDIESLRYTTNELESAMQRALELYTTWLAEDIRLLWPLLALRNNVGQGALDVLRQEGLNLKGYAEDTGGAARADELTMIPRFCEARWSLRSNAAKLEKAAGRG